MSTPTPSHRLGRAILLGLTMGFFAGAGLMSYGALTSHRTTCVELTPAECELKLDLAKTHARSQALTALAFIFLGSACILLLRSPKPRHSS